MKTFLTLFAFLFINLTTFSQKLKSGAYIFKFCDLEYNKCISTCKVVIKGDSIFVYATKELAATRTHTKQNDLIEKGLLKKLKGSIYQIQNGPQSSDPSSSINFKKKEFWSL